MYLSLLINLYVTVYNSHINASPHYNPILNPHSNPIFIPRTYPHVHPPYTLPLYRTPAPQGTDNEYVNHEDKHLVIYAEDADNDDVTISLLANDGVSTLRGG